MASIILKIDDNVPHKDLDRLRLNIVKSLKQQGVPVFMSFTDYMCKFDIEVSQNDKPIDMTTPNISA
jgi:hypothetical protein